MADHMKLEVVSRETIKPSRPTPPHLRNLNLSFLDQIAPPIYVPLIFFYTNDGDDIFNRITASRHHVLKKSLSETLTRYYPFAGRIKDDSFIVDCNDEGVDYVEAKVHNDGHPLSEIIQHPDIHLLKQFLPCEPYGSESGCEFGFESGFNSKVLLAVQVSFFDDCSGMVIGVCISHKMADASSLTTFINDWAATAHGAPTEQIKSPDFDHLPSLFPPRDLMGYETQSKIKRDEIVTKKFVFNGPKIEELKKRFIIGFTSSTTTNSICESADDHDDVQKYPTRVEAVSAFIWKCFINVNQAKQGDAARIYVGSHSVNMRTRIVPPLPANSMGNMYCVASALTIISDNNPNDDRSEKDYNHHQYSNLVGKIRDAIRKIDGDHVRELQTTDALLISMKPIEEGVSSGQTVLLIFSSWCRFPIYEADFSWGKPIWVSTATLPFKNVVVFMDTRTGDGIEAWVNMTEEDMAEFERDEELLAFTS